MSKTRILICLLLAFGLLASGAPAQAASNGYYTVDTSSLLYRTFYPTINDGYKDTPGNFAVFMRLDEDNYEPRHFLLRWEVLDSNGQNVGVPATEFGDGFPSDGELDFCGQYYDYCKRWGEVWGGQVVGDLGSRALPVGEYTIKAWSYDNRSGTSSERLALTQTVTIAKGTRTVTRKATRNGRRTATREATRSCSVTKSAYRTLDLDCGKKGYARVTWKVTTPKGATDLHAQWDTIRGRKNYVTLKTSKSGRTVTFTARVRGHNAYVVVYSVTVKYKRVVSI